MISRRVNSLRDEFYPDFEMVLHNRTLEYPSRKALKLERHNCFIFSPMVLGQQGAKLIFYQCLHYSLQPIYGLWNTIKSTMNNCVKKEDKSLSPWGGGGGWRGYGPPACLPCVTSVHTNEQKVIYAWMIQNMQEGHLRKCTGNYRMSVVELLLIISRIILC